MTVLFHPEFGQDILRFQAEYAGISSGLAERFRKDDDQAIEAIIRSPGSAGHIVQRASQSIEWLRRRNLRSFPFFVLYGTADDRVIFGSIIPSRSDPLTWLLRFEVK